MTDTNYIGCIVKILETPKQKIVTNKIVTTEFRVQLPQIRNQTTTIAKLTFWGNLGRDVLEYFIRLLKRLRDINFEDVQKQKNLII